MNYMFVDGNWCLHRAWSAMGHQSGIPTVRVPRMLLNWFCDYALRLNVQAGAMCFDGNSNFRYNVYPAYKSNRNGDKIVDHGPSAGLTGSDAVYQSLEPTRELFQACGLTVVQEELYEADDLLCSAGHVYGRLPGNKVWLVTRDKDMRGSITKQVNMYIPEMSKQPEQRITPELVGKKQGMTPLQWIDYQILVGDEMDSVPPVARFTPSKAKALLKEHRSLGEYFKTDEGGAFYRKYHPDLHRNKQLVVMAKNAWPEGLNLEFKGKLTSLPVGVKSASFESLKRSLRISTGKTLFG